MAALGAGPAPPARRSPGEWIRDQWDSWARIPILAGAAILGTWYLYGKARDGIDDSYITGKNPKALYSPVRISEDFDGGKLKVDFKEGITEIVLRSRENGVYEIVDSDGEFSRPERITYILPGGKAFTPKEGVGESHDIVLERADRVYKYATGALERRLKVK